MKNSFLTISLDFELFWGVVDVTSIHKYGKNIIGGRKAIPKILSLFKNYNIHATWGTVAMASFENKKELLEYLPHIKPTYKNSNIDPYEHLKSIGDNEKSDPYHFGYSLLMQIVDVEGMEIGSHSFSHFYCLENTSENAFKSDLESAALSFKRLGIETKSIIFCRNQYNKSDLQIAKNIGFTCYRGNEEHYLYKPRKSDQPMQVRAGRLIDAYINIAGHHLSEPGFNSSGLTNIPSSRFLRPISKNKFLENIRLTRIKSSMLKAAIEGKGYHLWWHPHNFGNNLEENIAFLSNILEYFKFLQSEYGMQSLNMLEASKKYS
tara:strand:- start:14404 stop:15363 length:960 start_codon:yes stop_codon:yes gene_type:complete